MNQSSTPVLPRPADPGWLPSERDTIDAIVAEKLAAAVRGVVGHLPGPERAVVVAEALVSLELDALGWCDACRASLPEGFCFSHIQGTGLVDAYRRHAYARLPGRPLIDIDL